MPTRGRGRGGARQSRPLTRNGSRTQRDSRSPQSSERANETSQGGGQSSSEDDSEVEVVANREFLFDEFQKMFLAQTKANRSSFRDFRKTFSRRRRPRRFRRVS